MAKYYAVTAYQQIQYYDGHGNQRHGMDWYIVSGPHATRQEAEAAGREAIGPVANDYGTDIYKDTQQKNMKVVSKGNLHHYLIRINETTIATDN